MRSASPSSPGKSSNEIHFIFQIENLPQPCWLLSEGMQCSQVGRGDGRLYTEPLPALPLPLGIHIGL